MRHPDAVCGSAMVLAIGFGWLGNWFGLLIAGWLAVGVTLLTRRGERVAVRSVYRYRRPTLREAALLGPLQQEAVRRCGLPETAIDWYVAPRVAGSTATPQGLERSPSAPGSSPRSGRLG